MFISLHIHKMCSLTNTQVQVRTYMYPNKMSPYVCIHRHYTMTHPPCLHLSSLVNQIVHHLSLPMEGCQVEGGVATLIHIRESRRVLLDQDLYHTEHCGRVKNITYVVWRQVAMSFMLHVYIDINSNVVRTDINTDVACIDINSNVVRTDINTDVACIDINSNVVRTDINTYVVRIDTNFNVACININSNAVRIDINSNAVHLRKEQRCTEVYVHVCGIAEQYTQVRTVHP